MKLHIQAVPDQQYDGWATLQFYAMANAVGGAVGLTYVTRTSHHKGHQQSEVRPHFPVLI